MSAAWAITWLGRACLLGAAAAIGVYVAHLAGARGWKRPWNAAGLFFTAITLTQLPFLFENDTDPRGVRTAMIATVCLLAAAGLQAFTALRRRRERLEPPGAPASLAGPPDEEPAA